MADGQDMDFTPYASGGTDTAVSAPTDTPVIDFSKYATPAPKGQIDFSQVEDGERSKAQAIMTGAQKLGVDPTDYATAISYESARTFDPWAKGPVTKWGQHRGTIQYGEPQQKQYGVTPDQSFEDQVTNSNVRYLQDHGVKPGASFQQIYSAINGGRANANLSTQDANTGRTIADNIRIADTEHRPEVQKRFGQYFGDPSLSADPSTQSPQPSAIQPGTPAQTPQITPEEQQAFDAQFPVEQYSPGYVDPNVPTPEQNAQNLYDASNELTAIGQAAAKGEKYVDPATQLVLEGGYKQAPDQTNVPQGTTRMVKDGQNYLTKQIGDNYSIAPENQAQKVAPTSPVDPQYQEYLKAGGETDSSATRQKFAQIMQGLQATTDKLNAQTANPNVQRLLTRWQTAPKPLDDAHLRSTDVSYHVDIPKGVDPTEYTQNVINERLRDDWGLNPDAIGAPLVPDTGGRPLTKDDRETVVHINRGRLADSLGVGGLDKVKADYYGEMPPQGLNPLENEQKAAAQPLTDNPFVRPTGNPLMDQAKANVMANPRSAGTDEAVQEEYERLQRTTPGEDEKYAANEVGKFLSNVDATGAQTGLVKGAAWLGDIVTGAVKLSPIGLLDYVTGNHVTDIGSRVSNDARLVAKSSSDHDTFIYEIGGQQLRPKAVGEAIGQAAVQVPVYVALSELPGGVTMAMAATEGLGSVGRGENALQVGGAALKGGALGALFGAAPRAGKFLEDTVLSATGSANLADGYKALSNEQLSKVFSDVQLPAEVEMNPGLKARAMDYISDKAQDEWEKQILVKTLLDPALLRTTPTNQLVAKLIGSVGELGTIGGGTFSVEKASGASNADALNSAIVNTLFGLTKYVPLTSLVGKVYRMRDGDKSTDVTIDPDGSVKELTPGAVPPGTVDAEITLPPSGPAQRTSQIRPEAQTSIESNPLAAAIVKALQGSDSGLTSREIMQKTGAHPDDISSTLADLYSAGAVEQMPKSDASGNRIRLIDENDVSQSLLTKPGPEPPTSPSAGGFNANETFDAAGVQSFLESVGITGKDARKVARASTSTVDGSIGWKAGDVLQKARELGVKFTDPSISSDGAANTGGPAQAEALQTEAPAKRIGQPLANALQRLPLDTRAQKIGTVLADGQPMTLADLAQKTKYNPAKINETIGLLYGAGKIEILSDGRVRLIEPLDKGANLYDQFDEKGRVPSPTEPSASATNSAGQNTSEQVTATGDAAGNGNITPPKTAGESQSPVAPTITPEMQAEADQSTGIATQVSPEQAARDAGSVTKDGVTYTRQEALPETLPTGRAGKVKFAENESPDFTYRIISADHLQPAHINGVPNYDNFLPEAQPKVRTDKASVKAADSIAAKINLDEVGESPNAYAGAPVINPRGEVIQGNNRAAGIKLSYGQSDDYKKQLASQAAKFGFTPEQVNSVKNPVLVRQVNADDNEAIRLGNFDELDTTSGGVRRIDPGKIAARIPHEDKAKILSDVFLNAPEDASLTDLIRDNQAQIVNHLKPYLSETQQQSMVENGKLTPKAVEDVKDTFTHFLFAGGKHELPELFDELPDKSQKGLTASLPSIFGVPEKSSLVTETQNALQAANTFAELRNTDKNLTWDIWQRQPDMLTAGLAPQEIFTPTELAIAQRVLDAKKASDIKGVFADYARLINGKEADLFGESTPGVSKAEAVKEIFNVDHQERSNPRTTSPVSESPIGAGAGSDTTDVSKANEVDASSQTQSIVSGSGRNAGTGDARTSTEPGTQLQPATEQPERAASSQRRAVTLDPVMSARVLYGREQGMTDSDIAQRYNLDPEAVASLAPLPAVGQGGQTSYKIIQNFVPSKTSTPEEYSDKVAMTNDLISEMGIPHEQRLTRDSSPGEVKTALDAARLKIANEMGKERGSQMDSSDWLKWLDVHAAKLSHDTTGAILDALGHQIDHNAKVDAFISDKKLVDAITRVHTTYGIDREQLSDFGAIPNSDLRKEILQLGYSYGLKKTAIERAYQRGRNELLEGIRRRSETGSEGRVGASGETPVETALAGKGSGQEEELGNIQFASGLTTQTDTPAFKKWFGDSKVVDENGDPLVVYHGTNKSFDTFKTPERGAKLKSNLGVLGTFFTESPTLASDFGRKDWSKPGSPFKPGANVVPSFIRITKPYQMPVDEFVILSNRPSEVLKKQREELQARGFDGIRVTVPRGSFWEDSSVMDEFPSPQYVTFDPHQIKSAIGNRGTFDPSNPNILFSSTTFDQTNLFGDPLTPQTEQHSLFDMGAPAEVKATTAAKLSEIVAPKTADYLNSLAGSDNKAVSKAANIVIGSSKYARSNEGKQAIEDAADALDTFARAEQAHTTVSNILAQQNLDGRTVAETVTPQAATFARAMENGDLGRTLNNALNGSGPHQIQSADILKTPSEQQDIRFTRIRPKQIANEQIRGTQIHAQVEQQSDIDVALRGKFGTEGQILRPLNMEGMVLMERLTRGIAPQYKHVSFSGAYYPSTMVRGLMHVLNTSINNAFIQGRLKSANKLTQLADQIESLVDPTHGDLVIAMDIPELPGMSKVTLQEETGHRANARSGSKPHLLSVESDALQTFVQSPPRAYASEPPDSLADEFFAKSMRDDYENELGISREARADAWSALAQTLDNSGRLEAYLNELENEEFEQHVSTSGLRQHSLKNDASGAEDGGDISENRQTIREARTDGSAGTRPLDKNDLRTQLRQTKLLSSGRREAEPEAIAFAKNTFTRKALDGLDKVLSTSEFSTTRALENVVNKGLQQLKKADEDAYEQVLKLAGTAAQATLEAMQTGVRDPAFIDALRTRNLDDVRITLELGGLAQPVTPGSVMPATIAGKPSAQMRIGDKPYYVPTWLKTELSNVLSNPHDPNVIQKFVDKLDTIGMAGPLDLFYHGTNVVATVIGGTPYAGTDILSRTIGNTPATKWLTALINTWRMNPEKVLAREPWLMERMAKAALIPASYGQKTYSKRLSGIGVAKKVGISLSPLLKGPKGLDMRTRILMTKIALHMNPAATDTELHDFVNQLGIYDKALQSQAVRFLTNSRIGRFAVAGTTMTKNGMLSWLNKGPLPIEDLPFAERTWVRAQQQFSGGPLGIAAILWVGASLLYRGMLPWKDKKSQFMRIPLNDAERNSPLVKKIYGDDGDVFVNLAFFSPLLERGGNALGINSAYNTAILGGNKTQVAESALTSSLNTAIHPVSTSPTTRAVFEGLTGNEMSIKGVRDKEGKSTLEMWPLDLPKGAGMGRKALEGALDLNPFVGSILHSFGVNRSGNKPDLLTDSENHILLQSMLDMTLPRLMKKTDLGKKRGYIEQQKRTMR